MALLAGGAALGVIVAAVVVPRLAADEPSPTVTVMTRNVYLGANISRPVRAARGQSGPNALAALGRANDRVRETVDSTDFRVRSRLLAAEIAATRPDLVGLQEVALWREGPLEPTSIGVPNAVDVDYDFLELLLGALEGRDLDYDVVQVSEEVDVEGPAFPDPRQETGRTGRDVRLTLRDVILVRADSGVAVSGRGRGQYAARLTVDLAGATFGYVRGFAWADVGAGGTRFRFVTTHLESESPEVAQAQATELLAGPAAATAEPVVLVGDLNSVADPPDPAYAVLTDGGFADTWRPDAGPGLTFGLTETVNDHQPSFEWRIDYVLARGLTSQQLEQSQGEVTGDEPADRDPATGLWPSDHAGVVVRLAIG
ncbi:MAG TPA: endonuclease/exonuclease/phosphatase family protein [Propionibacteriaceae bacterium]|nr:endonuclease/exonuclease/phosphatase family protein [Propionibacteriaceae bacterium]